MMARRRNLRARKNRGEERGGGHVTEGRKPQARIVKRSDISYK